MEFVPLVPVNAHYGGNFRRYKQNYLRYAVSREIELYSVWTGVKEMSKLYLSVYGLRYNLAFYLQGGGVWLQKVNK